MVNGESVRCAIIPFVVSGKEYNGVLTREQVECGLGLIDLQRRTVLFI